MAPSRQQKISELKQQLATAGVVFGLQNRHKSQSSTAPERHVFAPGFPANFPFALVQMAVLNEISATRYGDISPYGFALVVLRHMALAKNDRVLWCTSGRQPHEQGRLFAPGLNAIGVNPAKIVQLEARRTIDVLWAMEEAARSGALKAVIGAIDNLTFTQSRRLSLAAAHGKTPVFMIRPHHPTGASTAFSLWRLSSRPGQINTYNARAPGRAAFEVELYQCRDGRKGKWICHYENEKKQKTHRLSVVAPSGHRTPEPLVTNKRAG